MKKAIALLSVSAFLLAGAASAATNINDSDDFIVSRSSRLVRTTTISNSASYEGENEIEIRQNSGANFVTTFNGDIEGGSISTGDNYANVDDYSEVNMTDVDVTIPGDSLAGDEDLNLNGSDDAIIALDNEEVLADVINNDTSVSEENELKLDQNTGANGFFAANEDIEEGAGTVSSGDNGADVLVTRYRSEFHVHRR